MREIGLVMGVRVMRIGQIYRKLIKTLKDQLSDYVKG